MRVAMLLAVSGVVACSGLEPNTSYVYSVKTDADARLLAGSAAEFVSRNLPSSSGLSLRPVPAGQANNLLTPAIQEALKSRGFIVAENSPHYLRYWESPLNGGTMLRLSLDDKQASRFFTNEDNRLQPGGPYTLRQAENSR